MGVSFKYQTNKLRRFAALFLYIFIFLGNSNNLFVFHIIVCPILEIRLPKFHKLRRKLFSRRDILFLCGNK